MLQVEQSCYTADILLQFARHRCKGHPKNRLCTHPSWRIRHDGDRCRGGVGESANCEECACTAHSVQCRAQAAPAARVLLAARPGKPQFPGPHPQLPAHHHTGLCTAATNGTGFLGRNRAHLVMHALDDWVSALSTWVSFLHNMRASRGALSVVFASRKRLPRTVRAVCPAIWPSCLWLLISYLRARATWARRPSWTSWPACASSPTEPSPRQPSYRASPSATCPYFHSCIRPSHEPAKEWNKKCLDPACSMHAMRSIMSADVHATRAL